MCVEGVHSKRVICKDTVVVLGDHFGGAVVGRDNGATGVCGFLEGNI